MQPLEFWEWISNFIVHFMMDVVTHPCWHLFHWSGISIVTALDMFWTCGRNRRMVFKKCLNNHPMFFLKYNSEFKKFLYNKPRSMILQLYAIFCGTCISISISISQECTFHIVITIYWYAKNLIKIVHRNWYVSLIQLYLIMPLSQVAQHMVR